MENELINVIIPIFNAENFMDRCIQSIVEQTYQNIHIILVEDCSSDHSLEKCYEWEKKDNRIEVIALEKNGRAGNARNVGLDHIDLNEGYVVFIDSDDYVHPNYITYLYELLIRTGADFSWVSVHNTFEKEKLEFAEIDFKKEYPQEEMSGEELLKREDLRIMYCMVWGKLWKASLWKNVRFKTEYHFYEDGATTFKAIYNAKKVVYSDIPLYNYYYSPDSNTRSDLSEVKLRDGLQTEIDKIQFYQKMHEKELVEMAYVAYLSTLLILIQSSKGISELEELRKEAKQLYKKDYMRGVRNKQISKVQRCKYVLYRFFPDVQRVWIALKQRKYR